MTPVAFDVTPYDRENHEAFVKASWCRGAREAWETLARYLRDPATMCIVAHLPGDTDSLLGWACVNRGAVVFAYTRALFGRLRRRGLATSLLLRCGIDVSEPTPCLFWTPAAAEIAARGYRIYHAPAWGKEAA